MAPIADELATILRDPAGAARRCLDEDRLRSLTLAALLALAFGAVVFGAVVGSYRGGIQLLFAGVKFPLSMVAALVLSVPAFHGVAAALGRPVSLRAMITLALVAAGRAGLALLAFAPVLWLAMDLGVGYHGAALAAVLAYALAGVAALGVLLRGLRAGRHRITTGLAFVAIFLAASGQTSWILRPYLVRPQSAEVPFVRSLEGDFLGATAVSLRSSLGIYGRRDAWHDDAAPAREGAGVVPLGPWSGGPR
ncbi:MAG: hypothetical protein KF901_17950 [Myxococcales bacterium]|nr:hypothetical protein [Myxococcales bacterium]